MNRTDPNQPNLVDGSIYAYQIEPDGAYVTIKGSGEDDPLIVSFDRDDIKALRTIAAHHSGIPGFVLYAEASEVTPGLAVGVGNGPDGESAVIYTPGDEVHFTAMELAKLIEHLAGCLEALLYSTDLDAST